MKSAGFGERATQSTAGGLFYASVMALPVAPLLFGIAFNGAADPLQAAANTILAEAAGLIAIGAAHAYAPRASQRIRSRLNDFSSRGAPSVAHNLVETKRMYAAAKAAQTSPWIPSAI